MCLLTEHGKAKIVELRQEIETVALPERSRKTLQEERHCNQLLQTWSGVAPGTSGVAGSGRRAPEEEGPGAGRTGVLGSPGSGCFECGLISSSVSVRRSAHSKLSCSAESKSLPLSCFAHSQDLDCPCRGLVERSKTS